MPIRTGSRATCACARRRTLHVALLLASLAFLPIVTSARWKPTGAEDPTLWILGLLVATIGLPYFLLSTTGPLVQSWVARTPWGAQVYRYFSLSNLASLVSLLCYPVLIEPHSALLQQAWGWSVGLCASSCCCAPARRFTWRATGRAAGAEPRPAVGGRRAPAEAAPRCDYLLWLALPALGSWLLLAITNHITQNVAAIPFLWVLPLSVYLLSFVLMLRERPLVPPARCSCRWRRPCWCCAPSACRPHRLRHQDRAADLRRRPVRAVHVPARRDGAPAPGGAPG